MAASSLYVFRQPAPQVAAEVVPDKREYEADPASDSEQSGAVQSRGELWEEGQNSRCAAADSARQTQFGVSALAGEQSVDESAKQDADQFGERDERYQPPSTMPPPTAPKANSSARSEK